MIVQRPSVMERIEKGEAVGYVIIAVGVIGAVLALYQTLFLVRTRRAVRRQLAQLDHPSSDNPLGRVLTSVQADPASIEEDAEVVELRDLGGRAARSAASSSASRPSCGWPSPPARCSG